MICLLVARLTTAELSFTQQNKFNNIQSGSRKDILKTAISKKTVLTRRLKLSEAEYNGLVEISELYGKRI